MVTYIPAEKTDIKDIEKLLQLSNLPFSDITESKIDFIVAKDEDQMIGCIGLEKFGKNGLLRSFAVNDNLRNKGYGWQLYKKLLAYAVQSEIDTLHLLTNTAKDYFLKAGFVEANRDIAPETIKNSKEFSSLCPSTSTYMVLKDITKQA
jgi:amino-acid N-acetyltransferase